MGILAVIVAASSFFIRWIRIIPFIIAALYALFLIAGSISDSINQQSPEPFFVDGLGNVLAASDQNIEQGISAMKAAKSEGNVNAAWEPFLSIIGSLFLFYTMAKLIKAFFDKFVPEQTVPPFFTILITLILLWSAQTIFYSATEPGFQAGFRGLAWSGDSLLLNFRTFFYPVEDLITGIGKASLENPLF